MSQHIDKILIFFAINQLIILLVENTTTAIAKVLATNTSSLQRPPSKCFGLHLAPFSRCKLSRGTFIISLGNRLANVEFTKYLCLSAKNLVIYSVPVLKRTYKSRKDPSKHHVFSSLTITRLNNARYAIPVHLWRVKN